MIAHEAKYTDTMIDILEAQKKHQSGTDEQFHVLAEQLHHLTAKEEVDPNFLGTVAELKAYIETKDQSESIAEHVRLNELNIKRWIIELTLLAKGSQAVTIDFEQRKGREI
ncbi:YtzH-like family protein [Desertibacillus haloalkaliphilus]|uniref:YtzH-like family protein n=1 Tax=Desertibacillus haloalkaliphilus TaxID=1328930 RepID=UPI001C27C06C|nr:YtzH-like family protein [Desertibacillus haloalkaliphilus]MBU8905251.1 hypothetical protein [Desertibacillus haloalkaliphilus]